MPPVQHLMIGHLNPHCQRCGRTAMAIARTQPTRCERATLPFEFDEKPVPAKCEVRSVKERAS